jgi:hypothetical protein
MQREAVQQLIDQLPATLKPFEGSEYPDPVRTTLFGDRNLDIDQLRSSLIEKRDGPVKDLLESILLAA